MDYCFTFHFNFGIGTSKGKNPWRFVPFINWLQNVKKLGGKNAFFLCIKFSRLISTLVVFSMNNLTNHVVSHSLFIIFLFKEIEQFVTLSIGPWLMTYWSYLYSKKLFETEVQGNKCRQLHRWKSLLVWKVLSSIFYGIYLPPGDHRS